MIYTEMTKKALKLSFEAHKEQKDKGGLPYVYHPFHLAEQMISEEAVVVALLHDVVEDTDRSLDDIRAQGFPESVIEALALLTHDKATPYFDYVARVKTNPIAREVKLADLEHNADLSRLDKVEEKDKARAEKYRQAAAILREEPLDGRALAERAEKQGYPEFKQLVEAMEEAGEIDREDTEKTLKNIKSGRMAKNIRSLITSARWFFRFCQASAIGARLSVTPIGSERSSVTSTSIGFSRRRPSAPDQSLTN